ncbi:MAG: 2-deoxy-D-gluconate 3-dehydrogenase [Blastocatellia bacterium]|nr:MAG: 2-deoxy-D-gluconate 3-dehydrogenase [Blastocatellia bacterium]
MILPSIRLDGKIALVTGTGSGLGHAIAIGLATAGADVGMTELPGKEAAAEETAAEVRKAGRQGLVLPLDVRKLAMIGEAVDRLLSAFGRIDILINNAGVNVPKLAIEVTPEDWDVVLDTDLKGLFFTTQKVATSAMIPQGGGKIVNIASIMGVGGFRYRAAYCSAKAGVVNLTRVLAIEWAEHKINVNAIGPTFFDTPLTRPMFEDRAFYHDVVGRIPLGRLGQPEDVVGAAVFLCSPAADMVTGHTLMVDGGWTAL